MGVRIEAEEVFNVFTRSVQPEAVPGAAAASPDFDLLRSIPLFRYLEDAEIRKVLSVAKRQTFAAGTELIAENSMGTETFILLRGRAQLVKSGMSIGQLGPGHCFGEMTMCENAPRSASIWTHESVELLMIRRQDLYRVFQKD